MHLIHQGQDLLRKTIAVKTQLDPAAVDAIVASVPIEIFDKGHILLKQGDVPTISYFVLQGCVRQYLSDEAGKEITVDFFVENDPINMFSYSNADGESKYSLSCLEPCTLVACPHIEESEVEDPELAKMIQGIFNQQFTQLQEDYATFKILSPEARFKVFAIQKPSLLKRVPQHILASYLNITPETFSRFKKKYL